jgi:hypothetical protein
MDIIYFIIILKKAGSILFYPAFFLVGLGPVLILVSAGGQMLNIKRPCR